MAGSSLEMAAYQGIAQFTLIQAMIKSVLKYKLMPDLLCRREARCVPMRTSICSRLRSRTENPSDAKCRMGKNLAEKLIEQEAGWLCLLPSLL
jgi:hypothetical protein